MNMQMIIMLVCDVCAHAVIDNNKVIAAHFHVYKFVDIYFCCYLSIIFVVFLASVLVSSVYI